MNLRNMPGMKKQRLTSVLGLALDGSRLEGAVLRRVNGSLEVGKTFSVSLSLDPLTAEPELVGREIRNHLDAAVIRERFCVFGLPLKWALATQVEVPQLPEADLLLAFTTSSKPSAVSHSDVTAPLCRFVISHQGNNSPLVGVARNHLQAMEEALHGQN